MRFSAITLGRLRTYWNIFLYFTHILTKIIKKSTRFRTVGIHVSVKDKKYIRNKNT